jgi:hypothetical protein
MSEEVSEQEKLEAETVEIDVSHMTPKERIRYKARLRKCRQREHERAGIPSDPKEKLETAWATNRAVLMADPEKSAALEERLFDFGYIRGQMAAVIDRIRRGIHPESEQDGSGRFFDCIAVDVMEHVKKYGLVKLLPPEVLHISWPSEIEKMKADPTFHYRMSLGFDVDGLSNYEFEHFFEYFFKWYLQNRDNPAYDFDWEIADQIYNDFVIPEKFLTGILARPWRIWTKLHNRRNGISVETPLHIPLTEEQTRAQAEARQRGEERQQWRK